MTVIEITNEAEFKDALKQPFAMIDFYAQWCGPCKLMAPKYLELSNDPKYSKVKFYKLDVDEVEEASDQCGVTSLPTFLALENGQQFDSFKGSSPTALKSLIDDLVDESENE